MTCPGPGVRQIGLPDSENMLPSSSSKKHEPSVRPFGCWGTQTCSITNASGTRSSKEQSAQRSIMAGSTEPRYVIRASRLSYVCIRNWWWGFRPLTKSRKIRVAGKRLAETHRGTKGGLRRTPLGSCRPCSFRSSKNLHPQIVTAAAPRLESRSPVARSRVKRFRPLRTGHRG